MTVVFNNGFETFEEFNFSSVVSHDDHVVAINQIRDFISQGKYFKNSPKYQTEVNLFGLQDPVWMKLRMSFIFSCFMYLGKEVSIKQLMAWSFMTDSSIVEDRNKLWHTHQYGSEKTLSGVYYLHLPKDVDREHSGTEFAYNGVENPERFKSIPKDYTWIIYPGKVYHRPMPPQSTEQRFVLAADLIF